MPSSTKRSAASLNSDVANNIRRPPGRAVASTRCRTYLCGETRAGTPVSTTAGRMRALALHERARAALDTLTSSPWRRAPFLLWRRPGVLVPTAGAGMVLAASLASVPLFLSSAGTEAVELQAAERCPRDTGTTYHVPRPDLGLVTPDPFVPLADDLGPSVEWARIETTMTGPVDDTPAVVLYRDGAFDHVDAIEGTPGSGGVWLSDRGVDLVGDGDTVELGGVAVPVAGVYRDLTAGTISDRYWCAHRPDLLLRAQGGDLVPPPPVVMVDRATWSRLEEDVTAEVVEAGWEAPLRSDVTVTEARALVDELACEGPAAPDLAWCVEGPPLIERHGAPTWTPQNDQIEAPDAATFVERYFDSSLAFVADRSRGIQTAVGGGVWPVAVLMALAGAGLVAATALLWCDRRQREVTLLTVRGSTPAAIALKAVLELAGALLIGSAAGVALAYGLVVGVGPSPTLEPAAVVRAAWLGGGALLLSALVLAAMVVVRVRTSSLGHRRRPWLRLVPWEVALGLVTVLSYRRLDEWGVPVSSGARVSRIDVVGLMFPVLFLATMVAVAARVLVLGLRPLRSISRDWPSSVFLAVRRVARYRAAVIGMVAASALATGVFAYAATIQRSMEATLEAKELIYLGSDVVVRVPQDEPVPDALAGRSTSVDLYSLAWVQTSRREQVNVFAIDPATFAPASFWDDSLSSLSLEEIVDRLAAPPTDGRVPALVVGLSVPAVADAGITTSGTTRFEISQVADVPAFPGMRRGSAAMFVATPNLDDLELSTHFRELRVQGERSEVLRTLDEAGAGYEEVTTGDSVVDAVAFLTVSQTFGFMRSLAVASALLVAGGVAVYLDARRRSRVLASAFARRMGLTRRQHRRALLVEILAGVGVGCWLGLVVALIGAEVAHERIDPLPLVQPAALLRPATGVLVGLALAALVVASIAAVLAQRATDRDDPLEVLRGGT
jgi:putative ABC transport system permease protein